MSISFHEGHAVIQRWTNSGTMALLGGDGSVPANGVVEVPIMNDEHPGCFGGEYVSSTDRVSALLERFLRQGDSECLGDWFDL